jgi:PIN domain nuclease of toxin-antitoxin system
MKLLLDTHTFIWWDSDPAKLSPQALALCQDRANVVLLSGVSVWEMQIKRQLGKLQLRLPLADMIASPQQTNHIAVLPVNLAHHKDPFDRLLIAQAREEDAILVSSDPVFARYQIEVLW